MQFLIFNYRMVCMLSIHFHVRGILKEVSTVRHELRNFYCQKCQQCGLLLQYSVLLMSKYWLVQNVFTQRSTLDKSHVYVYMRANVML